MNRLDSDSEINGLKSETFLEKHAELKVELSSNSDEYEWTIFHVACPFGESKMANLIMKNAINLKIDLNARDKYGNTAFHYACIHGRKKTVKLMIENAESLNLDLRVKNKSGNTAFQCSRRSVVDLIERTLPAGTY